MISIHKYLKNKQTKNKLESKIQADSNFVFKSMITYCKYAISVYVEHILTYYELFIEQVVLSPLKKSMQLCFKYFLVSYDLTTKPMKNIKIPFFF